MTQSRHIFLLFLGVVLIGLGLYVGVRSGLSPGRPVTSSHLLDALFSIVFIVRGAMNVRAGLRTRPPRP